MDTTSRVGGNSRVIKVTVRTLDGRPCTTEFVTREPKPIHSWAKDVLAAHGFLEPFHLSKPDDFKLDDWNRNGEYWLSVRPN